MSLINEALKQAGQSGGATAPSPSPRAVGVLRPASVEPSSRSPLVFLLPIALLTALLMAFVVLKQAWIGGDEAAAQTPAASGKSAQSANASEDWFRPATDRKTEASAPVAPPQSTEKSVPPATGVVETKASAAVAPGVASVSEPAPASAPASAPGAAPVNVASATPVAPPAPVLPPPPAFKLQGITFSPSAPSALVNGRAVFIGDEVDGAQVMNIDQRSVTLNVGGKPLVLRMR